jgi:heavy metal sensor kinase
MWRFRLIRFRLTLIYTLLLTGAFALFSVGIFVGLDQVLNNDFYNRLSDAADNVVKDSKITATWSARPYYHISLHVDSETVGGDQNSVGKTGFFDVNGQPLPGDQKGDPKLAKDPKTRQLLDNALVKGSPQTMTVQGKHGDTTVLAVPINNNVASYVLVLQESRQQVEDTLSLLQRILILSMLAFTGLSVIGAWFLTGRVLRPIDQITDTVRRITARDLSQRLAVDSPDEIGRLAGTFNDMIARLQASFERQKRFTSDASHELRTPLTVMQADISLALRRPRSAPEYQHTLESAQEEVARLSHIVNDLLTLTRLDTDVAQVAHEPVALDDLLGTVVAGLRPLAAEKRIAVTYTINAPVTIPGDVTRLKQLFVNLIDNALAYTPDGGAIRVALVALPDLIEVTVSDTGIGIAPEHLPHIFERFYRADEARARNHEGTGLGLAIAQSSAQAHQGCIEVSSEVGQGSTFRVQLPPKGVLAGQDEAARLPMVATDYTTKAAAAISAVKVSTT